MITFIDDELVAKILALKPACRRLNLSNNAITTVVSPNPLVPLAQLTFLDVSNNFLTELGSHFSALVSLRVLNAANNRISDISGLSACQNLCRLDVAENHLSSLEQLAPLLGCAHLRTLKLAGNPLCMHADADTSTNSHDLSLQLKYDEQVREMLPQLRDLDPSDDRLFATNASVTGSVATEHSSALTHKSVVVFQPGASPIVQRGRWAGSSRTSPSAEKQIPRMETVAEVETPMRQSLANEYGEHVRVQVDSATDPLHPPQYSATPPPVSHESELYMISPASSYSSMPSVLKAWSSPLRQTAENLDVLDSHNTTAPSQPADLESPTPIQRHPVHAFLDTSVASSSAGSSPGPAPAPAPVPVPAPAPAHTSVPKPISRSPPAATPAVQPQPVDLPLPLPQLQLEPNIHPDDLVSVPRQELQQLIADRDQYYTSASQLQLMSAQHIQSLQRQLQELRAAKDAAIAQLQDECSDLRQERTSWSDMIQRLQHDMRLSVMKAKEESVTILEQARVQYNELTGLISHQEKEIEALRNQLTHEQATSRHQQSHVKKAVSEVFSDVFHQYTALQHVVDANLRNWAAKVDVFRARASSASLQITASKAKYADLSEAVARERKLWSLAVATNAQFATAVEQHHHAYLDKRVEIPAPLTRSAPVYDDDSDSDDEFGGRPRIQPSSSGPRQPKPLSDVHEAQRLAEINARHHTEIGSISKSLAVAVEATDALRAAGRPSVSAETQPIPVDRSSISMAVDLLPAVDSKRYLAEALFDNMELQNALSSALAQGTRTQNTEQELLRAEHARATTQIAALAPQCKELQEQVRKLMNELDRVRADHEATEAKEHASRTRQLSTAREASLRARAQAANLEAQLDSARSELASIRTELNEVRHDADQQLENRNIRIKQLQEEHIERLAAVEQELAAVKRERNTLLAAMHPVPRNAAAPSEPVVATAAGFHALSGVHSAVPSAGRPGPRLSAIDYNATQAGGSSPGTSK